MYRELFTEIFEYLTQHVGVRYFLAGGTGGVTDLGVLYLLNHIFGLYYLLSAIIAFLVAFCLSFVLHKFWTFKSHETETHKQAILYFGTSMFGLLLNTILMYIFVSHFHNGVIFSQIVVGFMVAFSSFFISRNIVFKFKPV